MSECIKLVQIKRNKKKIYLETIEFVVSCNLLRFFHELLKKKK